MQLSLRGRRRKVGTKGYMSPEAWRGEIVGFESDVWSLGIVVYVVFVGELPFEPEDEVSKEDRKRGSFRFSF